MHQNWPMAAVGVGAIDQSAFVQQQICLHFFSHRFNPSYQACQSEMKHIFHFFSFKNEINIHEKKRKMPVDSCVFPHLSSIWNRRRMATVFRNNTNSSSSSSSSSFILAATPSANVPVTFLTRDTSTNSFGQHYYTHHHHGSAIDVLIGSRDTHIDAEGSH